MLKIDNVHFSYHNSCEVLTDISLQFSENQLVCLWGKNGSSKSTLINLLAGKNFWQSGEYFWQGECVLAKNHSLKHDYKMQMGYLPQGFSSDEKLTLYDNLMYSAWLYGIPQREISIRIQEALNRANLESLKTYKVKKLSFGMRRRLEIYRTFMHKPKIVFLDEPTESLDTLESKKFLDFLCEYKKTNNALIILSSQKAHEAQRSDFIVMMNKGQVIGKNPPAKFILPMNHLQVEVKLAPSRNQNSTIDRALGISFPKEAFESGSYKQKLSHEDLWKVMNSNHLWGESIQEFIVRKPDISDAYSIIIEGKND